MHDGSQIVLKKLGRDYDPTNRAEAMLGIEEANAKQWLITGLIYIDEEQPSLLDRYDLPDTPLNRLPESRIRPSKESLDKLNKIF